MIKEEQKTKEEGRGEDKSEDKAAGRHVDSWERDGKEGTWTRVH